MVLVTAKSAVTLRISLCPSERAMKTIVMGSERNCGRRDCAPSVGGGQEGGRVAAWSPRVPRPTATNWLGSEANTRCPAALAARGLTCLWPRAVRPARAGREDSPWPAAASRGRRPAALGVPRLPFSLRLCLAGRCPHRVSLCVTSLSVRTPVVLVRAALTKYRRWVACTRQELASHVLEAGRRRARVLASARLQVAGGGSSCGGKATGLSGLCLRGLHPHGPLTSRRPRGLGLP